MAEAAVLLALEDTLGGNAGIRPAHAKLTTGEARGALDRLVGVHHVLRRKQHGDTVFRLTARSLRR